MVGLTTYAPMRLPQGPLPALDWNLEFEHPMTIRGCKYWRERAASRTMPARPDLDPVAMRSFATHVGLIEIRQSERTCGYLVRLAGSRWEEVFGPMTGRMIDEFLPAEIQKRWHHVFDAVRAARAPVRAVSDILFGDKFWLACEMFVAPLGDGEHVNMLFMTFAAECRSDAPNGLDARSGSGST